MTSLPRFTDTAKNNFILAVKSGDVPAVQSLLDDGMPADTVGNLVSGLYVAAAQNDVPMLETLVAGGANPNLVLGSRSKQRTALNKAAGAGSGAALEWLLGNGANPRITDLRRRTAGHILIGNLNKFQTNPYGEDFALKMLGRMLDLGLPINQVDGNKHTLLHSAVLAGKFGTSAIELLMDCDANPFVTDKDGLMPIHIASRGSRETQLRILVRKGVSINLGDEQERTPLHLYDKAEIGEVILALGADLESQDIDGNTPLLARLRKIGTDRVTPEVEQLISHGASLGTPAFDGETAASVIRDRKLGAVAVFIGSRNARILMRDAATRAQQRNS